jgi:hypothetical protein
VGIELPGLEEAIETALLSAREIIADEIKGNAKTHLRAIIIAGPDLLTIPARDVFRSALKSEMLSSRQITASPSIRNEMALMVPAASTIAGNRVRPVVTRCA